MGHHGASDELDESNARERRRQQKAEREALRYARLCDYFWRLDYPDTPKGQLHTSDVCRARASCVLAIMECS